MRHRRTCVSHLSLDDQRSSTWVDKKDYFVLIFVFLLLPIMSHAGGLGIAAIAGIGGGLTLIGVGPKKLLAIAGNAPKAFWAVMLLLVYGVVSSLWSPYQSNRTLPNPIILVLGVPLYFLLARAIVEQSKGDVNWLRPVWIWGSVGSAFLLLIDLTTNYSISLMIDPVSPGESVESRRGDLIQNLGHGVAVSVLLFPAVAVALWQRGIVAKTLAVALAFIILLCGFFAGMSASVLAMCCALLMMAFAAIRPKFAIVGLHILAGIALLGAPIFAFLTTKLSDAQLEKLPFSWEERIHNWRYIFNKIGEHPIVGHGFDAVRTFDDKHSIRGFDDRAIVSLHPHSAGLHIWVELGFVGIFICLGAVFLSYKHIVGDKRPNRLFAIALCGIGAAALVNSSLTFGVWQDWWWAAIIIAFSTVALIPYTSEKI